MNNEIRNQSESQQLSPVAADYLELLLTGNRDQALDLVLKEIENNRSIEQVYLGIFQPAQHQIGELWQRNKISVAQEHYCTAVTQMIMSHLYPRILNQSRSGPRMIATCVSGELHELGIRMVSDLFELAGWTTIYLGGNMPAESILDELFKQEASLLAISATMTFHIPRVEEMIRLLRNREGGDRVNVLVGGRPFNLDLGLWEKVGADATGQDAALAVKTAAGLQTPQIPTHKKGETVATGKRALEEFRRVKPQILQQAVDRVESVSRSSPEMSISFNSIQSGLDMVLRMLDAAASVGDTVVLDDQLAWARERLPHDGVNLGHVLANFKIMSDVMDEVLSPESWQELEPYLGYLISRQEEIIAGLNRKA